MRFGDFTLRLINGGNFRLDGGAMHGVVPKTIWSRLVSCDDRNRCEYATNCLLIEGRGRRVLVETGNGDKFSAKEKDIFTVDAEEKLARSLRAKVEIDRKRRGGVIHVRFGSEEELTGWSTS